MDRLQRAIDKGFKSHVKCYFDDTPSSRRSTNTTNRYQSYDDMKRWTWLLWQDDSITAAKRLYTDICRQMYKCLCAKKRMEIEFSNHSIVITADTEVTITTFAFGETTFYKLDRTTSLTITLKIVTEIFQSASNGGQITMTIFR